MPTLFEWESKTMKGYIMPTLLKKISLKIKMSGQNINF